MNVRKLVTFPGTEVLTTYLGKTREVVRPSQTRNPVTSSSSFLRRQWDPDDESSHSVITRSPLGESSSTYTDSESVLTGTSTKSPREELRFPLCRPLQHFLIVQEY